MFKNRNFATLLSFLILTGSAVIFIGLFTYNYYESKNMLLGNAKENAQNLTASSVHEIEKILLSLTKIPDNMAFVLENSTFSQDKLHLFLRSVVDNNNEVYGSCIAFEPHAFNKDSVYFAPYYYKTKNSLGYSNLDKDSYQYVNWDWYKLPKQLGRSVWSEPYYDEGGGNIMMATYSVPFFQTINGQKQIKGIVTIDISLSWLKNIVSSIKLFESGYAFLISKNGKFITYPQEEYILNKSIFSIARDQSSETLSEIGENMIQGKSGFAPVEDGVFETKSWVFYNPLPLTSWSMAVVFSEDELFADIYRLYWAIALIGISGLLILFIIAFQVSRSITGPLKDLVHETDRIA
ncbi:MAG: cache domain-containing protein [Calditrichaceae bacterium]